MSDKPWTEVSGDDGTVTWRRAPGEDGTVLATIPIPPPLVTR